MSNPNNTNSHDARMRAYAIDLIKATDKADMEDCVSELQKTAGLDEESARIVASAFREVSLPNYARSNGLDEETIDGLIRSSGTMTADFADEADAEDLPAVVDEAEEPTDDEHLETLQEDKPEVDLGDDMTDDEINDQSEALGNDAETDTIQIEVPTHLRDTVQQAIQEALGDDYTVETEFHDPAPEADLDGGDNTVFEADQDNEPVGDEESDKANHFARVNTMDNNTRAAKREAIKAQVASTRQASDEKPRDIGLGDDTSHNGKPFEHAADAQYMGEDTYPTMTMESSGGNSLQGDNVTFDKQAIPTKNFDNLQLKDSYDKFSFEGGEGDLEYTVDFDSLDNVPSADPDRDANFEIPTQKPENAKRKRTVASASEDFEDEDAIIRTLMAAGIRAEVIENMTYDQGKAAYNALSGVRVASAEEEVVEAATEVNVNVAKDEAKGRRHEDAVNTKPHKDDESGRKANELYKARVKTAYAVCTKLALANLLEVEEVDAQVDAWIEQGLPIGAMLNTGELMLRGAKSAGERVAAAQTNKSSRTAAVGISSNPAFVSTGEAPAQRDLHEALRSINWSGTQKTN